MSTENNGGSAFPIEGHIYQYAGEQKAIYPQYGMSLRDWFAGQALIGLLSNVRSTGGMNTSAEDAYKVADAMLEARKS